MELDRYPFSEKFAWVNDRFGVSWQLKLVKEAFSHERCTSIGRHTQGRFHPDIQTTGASSWDVSGPHFAGWEIYHLKGSPVDPDRLYASQSSGWFGQVIQRSDDGGKTWDAGGQPVRL